MSTENMKELPTVNYRERYKVTDKFVTDFGYVYMQMQTECCNVKEAEELDKFLKDNKYELTIARLTEFTAKLSYFPYKFVNTIMANISRCREIYFMKIAE